MENRLEQRREERPGAALFALAAIVVITAAWWALALWPVGSSAQPEWLARTRSACFGAQRGGLPDAGGWILLIGEPLGMFAALLIVWGASLRKNLAWLYRRRAWRLGGAFAIVAIVAFFTNLGMRVARAEPGMPVDFVANTGVRTRLNIDAPSAALVDQRGRQVDLANLDGRPLLLTFAFGHCAAVCPSIISDLKLARRESTKRDVRIAVLTLDPWRDVPERLPMLASHWKLEKDDLVLSGEVKDVEDVLDLLGIGRKRNEKTGDVDHATTVMLLDAKGHIIARVDAGARRDFESLLREIRG